MGIADCCAPAAADDRRREGGGKALGVRGSRDAAARGPAGRRSPILTWCAPGSAADFATRRGTVGVSILGSTGMHMRFVPTPDDVRLNEDRSGYTMCFPVERACASMQSNMAATLNIDWLMDMAREAAEMAGAKTSRAALLSGLDDRVLGTEPGQAVYHPYIFEAGERGPFLNPDARAQFSGLSTQTSFAGLARAVFEGLAFAARDCYLASGSIPSEVRLGGGAARSKAMRAILAAALNANVRTLTREELGASGAAMMAAVNIGVYPRHECVRRRMGRPVSRQVTVPDPQLSAYYAKLYPIYRTIRAAMSPAWDHLGRLRAGVRGVSKDRTPKADHIDHGRPFHAAVHVRAGDPREVRRGARDPIATRCRGPTNRWSTAMPSRAWRG